MYQVDNTETNFSR